MTAEGNALQEEHAKLQKQKEVLYAGYGKRLQLVRERDVIRRNADSILTRERQSNEERHAGLQRKVGSILSQK